MRSAVFAWSAVVGAAAPTSAQSNSPELFRIIESDPARRRVVLEAPLFSGNAAQSAKQPLTTSPSESGDSSLIGDLVVSRLSRKAIWIGRIVAVDAGETRVVSLTTDGAPPVGDAAVHIPRNLASLTRNQWPSGVTLRAAVDRVASGGRTAWLDGGSRNGFRPGDHLLALRQKIPVARIELTQVYEHASLGAAWPLAANATIEEGDEAELSPSPWGLKTGRLETRVELSEAGLGESEVWLPVQPRDGAKIGQRWEIRRDGEYVDLVQIESFRGRFGIARSVGAFARQRTRPGDAALLRRSDDVAAGRFPLRVFRVEGTYCLLNAGEDDRVALDQMITIARDHQAIAKLLVRTVKVDYCGAAPSKTLKNDVDDSDNADETTVDDNNVDAETTSQPTTMPDSRPASSQPTPKVFGSPVVHAWDAGYLGDAVMETAPIGRVRRALPHGFAFVHLTTDADAWQAGDVIRVEGSRPVAAWIAAIDEGDALVYLLDRSERTRIASGDRVYSDLP